LSPVQSVCNNAAFTILAMKALPFECRCKKIQASCLTTQR
jgi:hypothetical protein